MEWLPRYFRSCSAPNRFDGKNPSAGESVGVQKMKGREPLRWPLGGRHLGSFTWGRLVNTVAECTVPEKILLAAHQLEQQGQSPFSAEALIVAAWQKFPRTFGLKGYSDQYPD